MIKQDFTQFSHILPPQPAFPAFPAISPRHARLVRAVRRMPGYGLFPMPA